MRIKLPFLAMLVTLIVGGWVGKAAWSSAAAQTDVVYFDLVVDESRQLLYGSDWDGGSIQVVSMTTLDVVSTVSVGSQPAGLDISPDGNELAVALFGQGEIAFIALDTLSVVSRIVPAGTFGPNKPYDVLYGRPGRLYSVGNPDSSGLDYVHVFDTNTKMEVGRSTAIMRAAPRLAMTTDQNTLYVSEVSFIPQKIYRFDITSDTPVQTAAAPHGPVSVKTLCVMSDNRVYTSRGQVWSADLTTLLGTFSPSGDEIECSDAFQRAFVSSSSSITAIDTVSLSKLFGFNLGYNIGVARLNDAEETLYVSTSNGIKAFRADLKQQQVYLPLILHKYCSNFFDDFSNPASGWEVGEDSYVRTEYLSGEYRILSKQDGYFYLFGAPTCDRENYTVEVDARWQGTPGSSYGIIFGITDNFNYFYLFDVNTDYQQFRLYSLSPSGFTEIVAPTYSSAIMGGTSSNHLGVTFEDSVITLYANGTLLGTWWYGGGIGLSGAGLVSSPYDGSPSSDARFDNFSVVLFPTQGMGAKSSGRMDAEIHEGSALENHIEPVPVDLDW